MPTISPKLPRLDRRISVSKRWGRIALAGVILISLVFGAVLVQGLLLALEAGRRDLIFRALAGLTLLVGLDVFSLVLVRRQHTMLDEVRSDLEDLVRGDPPH
jgi:hypothetical protein